MNGATVTFVTDSSTVDTPAGGQPKMSSSTGTVTETVHTGATFNGHAATDVRVTSSDGNFTSDNYEGYSATSIGQNYVLYGQTTTRAAEQYSRTFVDPDPSIIDEVPEITGATWSNSLAFNDTINQGPANNHSSRTVVRHADGSEVDTTTFTDGNPVDTVTDTYTTNANGTGSVAEQAATGSYQYSIGVPVQQGGALVIPITYTDSNGTQSYTVPDWYPGNGLPTAPFGSASVTDLGTQLPPAACSKGPQISGVHIRQTQIFLDLFGDSGTITEDYYDTPSLGVICYTYNETTRSYDYLGTGALTHTTTQSYAYALTSGIGVLSGRRSSSAVGMPFGFFRQAPRLLHDFALPSRPSNRP